MESTEQSYVIAYRLVTVMDHRYSRLFNFFFRFSPQREERKGWMGDAALTVNEALYNFDLIKLFINFLNSIVDSQGTDGAVPDTVPFSDGDYPADPNWGTALPTIAWQLYRHYNDAQILSIFYSNIRAYVESVRTAYKSTGLAGLFYSYSDWVPPPPQPRANGSLTSSFAFMHDISLLINISQILGYTNDTQTYSVLYQQLAEEFHQTFFNRTSNFYADGMQIAQILALALPHVVPNNVRNIVLEHLVSDIVQKNNHVSTGIIGTAQLYPLLSDNGYHDLALELITSITYPSYGYMFNNPYENATTLWELWDAPFEGPEMNSRNHIMFGSVGAWFYSHLAGIDLTSDSIIIRPRMVSESKKHLLLKVDCQLNTLHGLVHVAYTRNEHDLVANSIRLRLYIPANVQARVIFEPLFPDAQCIRLTEGDESIWPISPKSSTTKYTIENEPETGLMIVHIGSGQYEYEAHWK
jgi:alpha-L-rhamnosidase